ncbi:MAG: biotin--[acetyl-CoA-carboxylase] ligase [Archangiaceae bacterium]|nr:biotin--[acetyl-CoA-carboxylase] ligase [Archangiaceae bacterium]
MEVQEEQTQEEMILSFLAEGGDEYTSGAALSDKLGLSRTAVWKHVESLRKLGYRIEAIPSRGYRLTEVPDRLTSLELDPLLSTREIGLTLHAFEKVDSTNSTAFKLAADGAMHGEVVVAEEQTSGKGRRGRSWSSPPGKNLYCSLILRPDLPPARASELTLVAAVALAETLRDAGVKAEIKWPNDVQVAGRKIAGILTELSADTEKVHFVVVGIGVNLNCGAEDLPEELRETATSLKLTRGQPVMRALFTAALWTRFESWLDRHTAEGFSPVRDAWRSYSATLGQEVLVKSEARELRGTAEDIDEQGALLIRKSDGSVERVLAGDVEQVRAKKST